MRETQNYYIFKLSGGATFSNSGRRNQKRKSNFQNWLVKPILKKKPDQWRHRKRRVHFQIEYQATNWLTRQQNQVSKLSGLSRSWLSCKANYQVQPCQKRENPIFKIALIYENQSGIVKVKTSRFLIILADSSCQFCQHKRWSSKSTGVDLATKSAPKKSSNLPQDSQSYRDRQHHGVLWRVHEKLRWKAQ